MLSYDTAAIVVYILSSLLRPFLFRYLDKVIVTFSLTGVYRSSNPFALHSYCRYNIEHTFTAISYFWNIPIMFNDVFQYVFTYIPTVFEFWFYENFWRTFSMRFRRINSIRRDWFRMPFLDARRTTVMLAVHEIFYYTRTRRANRDCTRYGTW